MDEQPIKPKRKKTGGRKAHVPPLKKKRINLTDEQVVLLRKWGRGDVSAGLRWLIEQTKGMVHKKDEIESCLISEQTGGQHP